MSNGHGAFLERLQGILKPDRPEIEAAETSDPRTVAKLRATEHVFGRMFPRQEEQPSDEKLAALANAMREQQDDASGLSSIPAGMTFLGQFIDHDLTLETISKLGITEQNDEELPNFRTPRLELDSVYRSGPGMFPFLYDRRFHLVAGTSSNPRDLPRNNADVALIGDPRNDENLFISQLHGLFLRLHNFILDDMTGGSDPTAEHFARAQRKVRDVYQGIIVDDYLPAIVDGDVLRPLLEGFWNGKLPGPYNWDEAPDMPFEFSAAAFRFGHSQVRGSYMVNASRRVRLFDLGGFQAVPADHNIDWNLFFDHGDGKVQFARQIDTRIADTLLNLPDRVADGGPVSLPFRNMQRGQQTFRLPYGEVVAEALGVHPIDKHQKVIDAQLDQTPLWFYVLAEAEAFGGRLGPVGGTLVAGTLLNLLLRDDDSIVKRRGDLHVDGLDALTLSSVAKLVG
ncbi:MAG: hypothetical protein KDJ37_01945 [Hyphomicrobiaceae bacterium]|nr:hypothetical protein [Hyphomicrobiaceae bacterium]